jgi:uncharacterized protein (DUF983 family)
MHPECEEEKWDFLRKSHLSKILNGELSSDRQKPPTQVSSAGMEPIETPRAKRKPSTFYAILNGICPQCSEGTITQGLVGMKRRCPKCDYDLHPESGYYLGAMMVGFLATTILTVPPMIVMKVMGVEDGILLSYPFFQYLVLGPLLIHYAKVIWVHIGYRATQKMDRKE